MAGYNGLAPEMAGPALVEELVSPVLIDVYSSR